MSRVEVRRPESGLVNCQRVLDQQPHTPVEHVAGQHRTCSGGPARRPLAVAPRGTRSWLSMRTRSWATESSNSLSQITKIPFTVLARASLIEAVHVEDMGGQLAVVLPMLPSAHGVASACSQKRADMSLEFAPLGEPGRHTVKGGHNVKGFQLSVRKSDGSTISTSSSVGSSPVMDHLL